MKLKTPEADDKSEMAGRMYEACDLKMAIEGGHLKPSTMFWHGPRTTRQVYLL